jgi:CheY-like chemotaxis protein
MIATPHGAIDILVVEDDFAQAELALLALKESGISHRIYLSSNGQDAIDFLLARGKYEDRGNMELPKLVLLDLHLPVKDGLEVLKEVRSNKKTRELPIVVLSSSANEEEMMLAYQYGANSFTSKPFKMDQFRENMQRIASYWMEVNITEPVST